MEDKAPFDKVTRLEAAERQLKVAVRLFFERRDLIAVHALAAAAQDIVRQFAKARAGSTESMSGWRRGRS